MDALMPFIHGFETALTGWNLFYCLLGVTIGMLVGILPGLGPTTGIALLLPITFSMEAIPAIIMLSGIYYGAMYGGTVTSVLINTPGEAASVATCFDGYPMAKQGRAGTALGVAGIGSFIGGNSVDVRNCLYWPATSGIRVEFWTSRIFCTDDRGLGHGHWPNGEIVTLWPDFYVDRV